TSALRCSGGLVPFRRSRPAELSFSPSTALMAAKAVRPSTAEPFDADFDALAIPNPITNQVDGRGAVMSERKCDDSSFGVEQK
ncbi:MAG: hypothetical protein ACRELF_22435, partial [Gemmataceae bacterium]